jgi:hypothetical protein
MSCSIPTADRKTAPQSTTSFNLDEENSPNVPFGLLVPAVVIGMARPSASRLLVAGWYVGLNALTFLLAWVGRGLGRASRRVIIAACVGCVEPQRGHWQFPPGRLLSIGARLWSWRIVTS